jgi:hypothetical protein
MGCTLLGLLASFIGGWQLETAPLQSSSTFSTESFAARTDRFFDEVLWWTESATRQTAAE